MKKLLLLSLILGSGLTALAAPRGEMEARAIAAQFLDNIKHSTAAAKGMTADVQPLTLAATATSLLGNHSMAKGEQSSATDEALYIYNMGSEAFVIVSGDDSVESILAYSDSGAFATENVPEHIKRWLQTYVDEQNYYTTHRSSGNTVFTQASASAYPSAVAPILKSNGTPIEWSQDEPFNGTCPNYKGFRSVVGCVATSMAQLMYYNRWPEKGSGNFNYITGTHRIPVSCDFSSMTFDYDKMLPHYYAGKYTDEEAAEAAKLSFAAGVAVEMDFSPNGSGTSSMFIGNAMVKYFNYDKNIHYALRDYFTLAEWQEMIKKEINEGRPVCYNGYSTSIGHQFIFDGYDANDMVHINWGWAGMSDGYYRLSVLSPSVVGTGGGSVTTGGFAFDQGMWIGIQKPSATSVPNSFFIIDGKSIAIDKSVVLAGEDITVSLPNFYNASVDFDGEMGLILESEDGSITVLQNTAIKLGSGFGRDSEGNNPAIKFTAKLAQDIADGNYLLYIATKQKGEPTWKRVRSGKGYNDRFGVSIVDGKAEFASMVTEPQCEGTLSSDHAIYTRCRSNFTARITNTSKSEYFGKAHVGIYRIEDGETKLYALCGNTQVSLPVGKEVEVLLNGSIDAYGQSTTVSQGNYKAGIVLEYQDKLYLVGESIDITIKRIPSGMAQLVADEFKADNATLPLDGTLEGTINVRNTVSVYSGNIAIIVFKKGESNGKVYWEKEIFVEKDSSAEKKFSIPVQWSAGDYKADLRYNENYTSSIASFEFTVTDEITGIDNVITDYSNIEPQYYSISGVRLNGKPARGAYIVRYGNKTYKLY